MGPPWDYQGSYQPVSAMENFLSNKSARCADWTVLKQYYFPLVLDISIKIYAADSEWQMTR